MKILAIIYLILKLSLADAQVLSIKSETKFPHLMENPFSIQIQPLNKSLKLRVDATDTMVIRIVDSNFTEIERAILIYGVQYSMDEEFLGKCMDIKIWEINPSSTKMNISIIFKRNAHNKYLEIFYFSASNKFQRKSYLKNLTLAKRLFHKVIDLIIPSKLSILVHPINVDRNEIIINDLVMASCRAIDGIPKEKPKFGNYFHLNVTETKYNENDNEIKMYFRVSLRDHFSYFTCMAGNVTEMYTIRINHHPTKLYIHPIIKKRLRSNSTIKCLTTDGYPDPEINWLFIEGPQNADLFYRITGNRHQIHINSNSPVGSKWTFKCIIKSNLTKTQKILSKIISFVIAKNPMEICGEKCLNLRISEIEESVEENSKLHEDIKLILNVTNQMKKQIEVQRKEQKTNEEIKIQIKALREKQKEMSDKLNATIQALKTETHSNFKYLNNSLRETMTSFQYSFNKITSDAQSSAEFSSIFPLTALFWNRLVDFGRRQFMCGLEFRNKQQISINIDMTYICLIFALKSRNKIKTSSIQHKLQRQWWLFHFKRWGPISNK